MQAVEWIAAALGVDDVGDFRRDELQVMRREQQHLHLLSCQGFQIYMLDRVVQLIAVAHIVVCAAAAVVVFIDRGGEF